jgi:hypothetical protein
MKKALGQKKDVVMLFFLAKKSNEHAVKIFRELNNYAILSGQFAGFCMLLI